MGHNIVEIKEMGDALRSTGYKNIESAVSEIVDNSVQAHAKDVFIILSESINPKSGRKVVTEIGFLDNGDGMDLDLLGGCLGIGVSSRKDRKGIGRFGVGLPQSSLYATPHVSVYSWQNGIENCYKVFLDIDKVSSGEQTEIDDPIKTTLPAKYSNYIKYKTPTGDYDFSNSGTLVIWEKCDNVVPRTRGPLTDRLEFELGRKFRYFIYKETSKIKIICDENQEAAVEVYPNDPLFLMDKNYVLGDANEPAKVYVKKQGDTLEPFFELYTADGIGNGEVTIPIKYYDKNGEIAESSVTARFSIVKAKFYDETAFPTTDPGRGQFGKNYAKKMEGISIVRADREIDFRQFDFYSNINQPEHRWWGCEILFTPELDEAFGVTNNKQFVDLKEIEQEDIDFEEEVQPIWLQLKEVISPTISEMYNKNKATRKSTRSFDNVNNPATDIINTVENGEDDDSDEPIEPLVPDQNAIDDAKKELENQGFEQTTDEQALTFLSNKINFSYEDKGSRSPAFDYKTVFSTTVITINTSHKFYTSFLSKIYGNKEAKTTFELFLASLIQSINKTNTYQQSANDKLISMMYSKLNSYIDEQLDPRDS